MVKLLVILPPAQRDLGIEYRSEQRSLYARFNP
jgi:hypothetical protein